jgi:putative transposase
LHINKTGNVLPKAVQAELLDISRSSLYYQPKPVKPEILFVMNRIDDVYTAHPFYGSRRIAKEIGINRKQAQRLMREMGIEALYPKPNLSKPNPMHKIYPYLLKGVTAQYPNHIVGTDITYIKMTKGFCYLTAFMDWFSRFVLSWRLSITLETTFCFEAAEEVVKDFGAPIIINEDQGSQNTDQRMTSFWESHGTQISMDSRGRALDNIFTERLWRSVKWEEVYLKEYATVLEARTGIGNYMKFYNYERKHQSLNYKTPAEIYFGKEENLT